MMPSSSPTAIMASDLIMLPWASTAAVTRASSIREKYSGDPNFKAISAIGGPIRAIRKVQTVPAKNEPMAEMASAAPARPLRAIW